MVASAFVHRLGYRVLGVMYQSFPIGVNATIVLLAASSATAAPLWQNWKQGMNMPYELWGSPLAHLCDQSVSRHAETASDEKYVCVKIIFSVPREGMK